MQPKYIHLDSIGSTSTWLRNNAASLPHATVVTTHTQTAGRGQRGNTWESLPGANLTFSMLLRHDDYPASQQFTISEAVALAVVDTLRPLLPGHKVTVKWPNDIYVDDRKICGTLIENSLQGSFISHSIAGIGININQQLFTSDAPNPVSLTQLTGRRYLLQPILSAAVANITSRLSQPHDHIHRQFLHNIYSPLSATYRDTATGRIFRAAIHDIDPQGLLTLRDLTDNTLHSYLFKQVAMLH